MYRMKIQHNHYFNKAQYKQTCSTGMSECLLVNIQGQHDTTPQFLSLITQLQLTEAAYKQHLEHCQLSVTPFVLMPSYICQQAGDTWQNRVLKKAGEVITGHGDANITEYIFMFTYTFNLNVIDYMIG